MPRTGDRIRMTRSVAALCTVVAAVVLICLPGCQRRVSSKKLHAEPRAAARAARLLPPGCQGPSSREDLLGALYSIYFRAGRAASSTHVRGWKPLPLAAAAEVLLCDPNEGAYRYRIRNAGIQLASASVILECRHRPHADFDGALALLGFPPALVREVSERIHCAGITLPNTEVVASSVMDTAPELADFHRNCCACVAECDIGPWGDVTVVEWRLEVNRDSACIFQAIDPQCWDDVVGLHFENTNVLDTPACVGNVPVCPPTMPCGSKGPPPGLKPTPPTPTQPWCGVLSETATASAYDIVSTLTTLLKVRTTRSVPGALHMDYGMCDSREWSLCEENVNQCNGQQQGQQCCHNGDCGIVRDCGEADVQSASTGNAVLSGSKQIHFADPVAPEDPNHNDWAQFAMKAMVDEIAVAMCQPPSCTGAPTTGCTLPPGSQTGAITKEESCTCPGPQDPCSLQQELSPSHPSPFCPTGGG